MARKAKIAATLGPASDATQAMAQLVRSGLDVARLNFSHGSPDEHAARVERLRLVARAAERIVGVMADLQGPRFRVGTLPGGSLTLADDAVVELVAGRKRAPHGALPVSHAALARDVKQRQAILIDDGRIRLQVERVRDDRVRCRVVRGGKVAERKGINLPGTDLSVPTITPKDRRDLETAVEIGADWLAVSFVRSARDVRQARRLLAKAGSTMPVMAKIERPEAIDRLDEILDAADGVLVARGDLGVELAPEDVPILQKQIIEAANAAGKPVVTATQMLDSMRHSAQPTRAEASDVANAVLDGSGCLLLTAETAVGEYPVEAVRMMARIIERAENAGRTRVEDGPHANLSIAVATAHAGCRAAAEVGARYLVAFTSSGSTAFHVSRFRPITPLVACTTRFEIARRMTLLWGVTPVVVERRANFEGLVETVDDNLRRAGLAEAGDVVVLIAGAPVGMPGTTNAIKVHRLG
ncbi:MAG TPA: pyruvate kinase [Candidatus Polarisedimenticolaceae bacterium]|nr:pyruvate kinase [Candidatus Polarisedimenticolaceae bacterium]